MSDTSNTSSKTPTHIVYHVRDGANGQNGFWTRIGAAWAHKDGKGARRPPEPPHRFGEERLIQPTGRAAWPARSFPEKGLSR
jgi:hypothetical protein